MIVKRLPVAAKQLSPPFFKSTFPSPHQGHSCGFSVRLLSTKKEAFTNDNAARAARTAPRDAPKEPGRTNPEKLIDYEKRSSFRASLAKHAAEEENNKKKKKRGPPGPVQFESLTAHTPAHSNLPFAFRYSYTEIPKVSPVGFQEKFSPFGPGRLDRVWDGQQAHPSPGPPPPPPSSSSSSVPSSITYPDTHVENIKNSKYSFKGVKLVNPPSSNLMRTHNRRPKTREEILGEALSTDEIKEFVESASKSKTRRQINMGRDGLTHNMLIEAHDHWKREPIVRVKCKGVPTVDMENVCFQLEDKTGGKIIHRMGGTIYLFRGRNYVYKERPMIPSMLWKPHAPLYPKLITEAPGGLKVHEANFLRKRGLRIMRLCILSKNGYYGDLVQHVKEAFEDDELVRIDCKGLNTSDYKKIGAKLRDLVPCYLLSFEKEQIILWKGRENDHPLSIGNQTKAHESEEITLAASNGTIESATEDIAIENEVLGSRKCIVCMDDSSDEEEAESTSEDQVVHD